jgi:predicted ATP-binding protein involved in virulence
MEIEDLEKVQVGKNSEYKTIEELFFLKGRNSGFNILLEAGIWENEINVGDDIIITGQKGTIITSQLTVKGTKSIFYITNCTFKGELARLKIVSNKQKCHVINNIYINNTLSIDILYSVTISNNTFIGCKTAIKRNPNFNFLLNSNVFINCTNLLLNYNSSAIVNPYIQKNIGYNIVNKYFEDDSIAFLYQDIEFYDLENNDFRIKDEKYKGIGASDELLLNYANLSKPKHDLPQGTFINKYANYTFYLNLSLPHLIEEYNQQIQAILRGLELENYQIITQVEELDIEKTSVFFALNAQDEAENSNAIFDLVEKMQKEGKNSHIFIPSSEYTVPKKSMNLPKMASIYANQEKLQALASEQTKIFHYTTFEDIQNYIYELSKVNNASLRIKELTLENIGHFQHLHLTFDDQVSCLIGLNGVGKTTILRALALALIGTEHKHIQTNKLQDLLKIEGLKENKIVRNKGKIILRYTINQELFTTELLFEADSEGEVMIAIGQQTHFELVIGDILKCLAIGFAQARTSHKDNDAELKRRNEWELPMPQDLIPLINNEEDNRLLVFGRWLVDLDVKGTKYENELLKEGKSPKEIVVKEKVIIQKIFDIFSEITGENIKFLEVRNNREVWVTRKQNPEGIAISLLSQGFQSVIGWIGYFLQRMAESYPTSKDFTKEPALCIVDEIDTYLHPKWQRTILKVLRNNFPNVQFIITTHSPLVLSNLRANNICLIEQDNNSFNPYGADTNRILKLLMGTEERLPEINAQITELMKTIMEGDFEKAEQLKEKLKQVIDEGDPEIVKGEMLIRTQKIIKKK